MNEPYETLAQVQADYARAAENLAKSEAEMLRMSILWRETEARASQLQDQLTSLQIENRKLQDQQAHPAPMPVDESVRELQAKLEQRHKEIASLTRMLKFAQHEVEREHEQHEWMRDIVIKLLKIPKWWGILPKKEFAERMQNRLAKSGLFDAKYYLNLYPDVDAAGMDPLQHYILHGIKENRSKNQ